MVSPWERDWGLGVRGLGRGTRTRSRPADRVSQSIEQAAHFSDTLVPAIFAGTLEHSEAGGQYRLGLQFRQRPAGDPEELKEIATRVPSVAFRDIAGNGAGGAPHLACESVQFLFGK